MPLTQEIVDFIKSKREIEIDVYPDQADELSDENLELIFAAETKEQLMGVLDEIVMNVIEGYDISKYEKYDASESLLEDVFEKFNLDSDDVDLKDEIRAAIKEIAEFEINYRFNELIKNTDDVNLTIAYGNKDNPKYWPDDFLVLPALWRGVPDVNHIGQDISNACALLGVGISDMREALKKKFDLDEPPFLPEASIETKEPQTTAEGLIYEWENATSDYSVLTFMTRINLKDYINKFERFQQDGIELPVGAYCGFHDPLNGSCSQMEIVIKTPLSIPFKSIEISAGDNNHKHGYSLENICGLTRESWGPHGVSLDNVKTEVEKNLLVDLVQAEKKLIPSGDVLTSVISHIISMMVYAIKNGGLNAREGLSDKQISEFVSNLVKKNYKIKGDYSDDQQININEHIVENFIKYFASDKKDPASIKELYAISASRIGVIEPLENSSIKL